MSKNIESIPILFQITKIRYFPKFPPTTNSLHRNSLQWSNRKWVLIKWSRTFTIITRNIPYLWCLAQDIYPTWAVKKGARTQCTEQLPLRHLVQPVWRHGQLHRHGHYTDILFSSTIWVRSFYVSVIKSINGAVKICAQLKDRFLAIKKGLLAGYYFKFEGEVINCFFR